MGDGTWLGTARITGRAGIPVRLESLRRRIGEVGMPQGLEKGLFLFVSESIRSPVEETQDFSWYVSAIDVLSASCLETFDVIVVPTGLGGYKDEAVRSLYFGTLEGLEHVQRAGVEGSSLKYRGRGSTVRPY